MSLLRPEPHQTPAHSLRWNTGRLAAHLEVEAAAANHPLNGLNTSHGLDLCQHPVQNLELMGVRQKGHRVRVGALSSRVRVCPVRGGGRRGPSSRRTCAT